MPRETGSGGARASSRGRGGDDRAEGRPADADGIAAGGAEVEAAVRRALAGGLDHARWSASKGRPVAAVDLVDAVWIPERGERRHLLAVALATFADGGQPEAYQVPLTRTDEGLREAVPGDGLWEAVAQAASSGVTVRGIGGGSFSFAAEPGEPAASTTAKESVATSARPARESPVGDQTHSSAVVGASRVVKVRRRLGPGGARELAIGRLLAASPGFGGSPALLASVMHHAPDGAETVLAVVHALVPDASDGYEATNAAARTYLLAPGQVALGTSTGAAAALGALTARLHLRLADAAAAPLPAAERRAIRFAGDASLADAVAAARTSERAGAARLAALLAGISARVASRLAILEDPDVPLAAALGHGDLHLGQTLVTPDGRWSLIDFEGEPVGASAGAAHEPPALRDAAGMLRSFDHVARSAARRAAVGRSDDPAVAAALDSAGDPVALLAAIPVDLAVAVDAWISTARRRFLAAYREGLGYELRPWVDARAIHALEVEKECYELAYAARVLPTWIWAPVGGIDWLLVHPPRPRRRQAGLSRPPGRAASPAGAPAPGRVWREGVSG